MLDKISEFYTKSFLLHGATPQGVGWKDVKSQDLRFEQLCKVISKQDEKRGITINDFGCGYGAMFKYLNDRFQIRRYYGYDICSDIIKAAKENNTYKNAVFIISPKVTHTADYSFISGTFTVKLATSTKIWTNYVKNTLIDISKKSRKGFAFNALTIYTDWASKDAYYADPIHFFTFCKQFISKYVSLINDYPLFEWTILVKKEEYYK